MLSMRRFAFFDKDVLRVPALACLDVTSLAAGRGLILAGDSEGHLIFVDRDFSATAFKAYKYRVNAIAIAKSADFCITIGDGVDARPAPARAAARAQAMATRDKLRRERDKERATSGAADADNDLGYVLGLGVPLELQSATSSRVDASSDISDGGVMKVWRLDRRDPRTGHPECVRTIRLFGTTSSTPPVPASSSATRLMDKAVSSMAIAEDLSQLALGCTDGSVILLRSDFARDRSANVKVQVLLDGGASAGGEGITFLAYTVASDPAAATSSGAASGAPAGALNLGEADALALADALLGSDGKGARAPRAGILSTALSTAAGATVGMKKPPLAAAASRSSGMLCLFSVTASTVRCFFPTEVRPLGLGQGWALSACSLLLDDEIGAAPRCATLNDAGELVTASDAGVFFYTCEEKRAAYPFTGRKQCISALRSHLIVASEDDRGRTALNIYDLKNKFIAFAMTLAGAAGSVGVAGGTSAMGAVARTAGAARTSMVPAAITPASASQTVTFIVKEWGQAFVLAAGAGAAAAVADAGASAALTVYQLRERDTGSKVEHLCRLQLFDTAAAVASASGYGKEHIADIHKAHGDFLYGNSEYDAAIQQYTKTIDVVEPSYVIRLFLDSQRIHNLTTYLEALHAAKKAASEHTTLLLNCYTKLRQYDKLSRFLRGETGADGSGSAGLMFDVRTAISVLREAERFDEALYLAEAHAEHDWYLQIQIEHKHAGESGEGSSDGAATALAYMRRMAFVDAELYIHKYGRALMAAQPDDATAFIIMMCTRFARAKPFLPLTGQSDAPPAAAPPAGSRERVRSDSPEEYLTLFVDRPLQMKRFLRELVSKAATHDIPPVSKPLWHVLLEVSLRRDVVRAEVEAAARTSGEAVTDLEAAMDRLREEDALQGVLKNLSADIDADHCLLLCQMHDYKAGALHLFERLRMYHMVLQHYVDSADAARAAGRYGEARAARRELLRKAKAFTSPDGAGSGGGGAGGSTGGSDAISLWVFVIKYLTRTYGGAAAAADGAAAPAADDSDGLFADALKFIDSGDILPPLRVVQLLSVNPAIPFGVIRDFIVRRLSAEEERSREDARQIESFRSDTHAMLNEAHRLDTLPVTFQTRKCRGCGGDLDLPSIHFMCGGMRGEEHSFHAHCVNDVEPECPLCAPTQRQVREIRSRLQADAGSRAQQEQFSHELHSSADGFLKCAEFLSKGVFDLPPAAAAASGSAASPAR